MTILLVTPELREDYMSVRWEVFVCEQNVPMVLEIDAWDFSADVLHLAAYEDSAEKIVGAARLLHVGQSQFRLGRLAVLGESRGRGIGRELVEAVHRIVSSHLHPRETASIVLEAQCSARRFYEKLGYTATTEEIIMDAGIEHVEMLVELQAL